MGEQLHRRKVRSIQVVDENHRRFDPRQRSKDGTIGLEELHSLLEPSHSLLRRGLDQRPVAEEEGERREVDLLFSTHFLEKT
jgi:hypothetical protein